MPQHALQLQTIRPFHTMDLHAGQKNAKVFDKYRKVGVFKGLVRLTDEKTGARDLQSSLRERLISNAQRVLLIST